MPQYEDFQWTAEDRLYELATGDTPWRYYLETAVRIETPSAAGIVTPVAESASEGLPPFGPLHVITAIQPDSDPKSRDNAARMALLDNELRAARLTFARAEGSSLAGGHSEASRAVFGLDDSAARWWGARYGQVAVFAWAGPRWSLLACVADRRVDRPWQWADCERNVADNASGLG